MSELDQAASPKKVPSWAAEPFSSFIRDLNRAVNFYSLTISGLSRIAKESQIIDELKADLRRANEEVRKRLNEGCPQRDDPELDHLWEQQNKEDPEADERIREASRLAKIEVDEGFPTLHRQVALSLWSSLEWLISNFLANWLANEPKAFRIEDVRKVKVSIADYEEFSGMDKYYYLLSEIERETKSGRRQGVDQFESTLQVFGLSGSVQETIKKDLFEFGHVRNVLVHRNGVTDARFVKACHWLELSAGQAVTVDQARLFRYIHAAQGYVELLAVTESNLTSWIDSFTHCRRRRIRLGPLSFVPGDRPSHPIWSPRPSQQLL